MRKKFIVRLISLLIMLSMSNTAFAASETKEVFTLDQSYNMAISILFDKEQPIVSFTAPDGTAIDGTSLSYDSGEDWIQYYIPDAAPGTWMITYDKLSNTQFEISYSSYMDTITISDFEIGEIDGSYLPASFTVTSESEEAYQYEIYAVITDDNNSVIGERLLLDGWADINQTSTYDIYIGDLSDYGNYKLRLDAWQKYGVEEAFDSKIADGGFTITGHSTGEISPEFNTEVNLTDGVIRIDWSETAQWGNYLVAIFNDDVSESEPFYYTEATDGQTSAEALFDPAAEALRIEFTHRRDGRNSPTRTKIVPIADNGIVIKSITSDFTNHSQATIEYEAPTAIMADVIVKDKTDTINLSGSGSFSIELPDAFNEVIIRYSLDDPLVKYIIRYQFTVDNTPPILRLPENKTALRVHASEYVLAGVTEPGAALNILGSDVTVNADGTFVHTISLSNGENIIKVISADAAGNVTTQDVIIIRTSDTYAGPMNNGDFYRIIRNYLPLILSFVVSIALLITILLVRKGYEKSTFKLLYIQRAIRNIILVLGTLLLCGGGYCLWRYMSLRKLSSGEGYFAIAQESIDKAYQAIKDMERYGQLLIYIGIIIGVCALLTVILNKVIKGTKNRSDQATVSNEESSATEPSIESLRETLSGLPADRTEQICRKCGAKYDKPVNFCKNCGEKM